MHAVRIQAVEVPAIGLGTWQMNGEACREGVRHALQAGYRHIDTAQMYGNEEQVGQGIRDAGVDRDAIFLTTKLNAGALAPERVGPETEASLRRLGTDRVDLLLIHWPHPAIPLAATLDAMRRVVDDGKATHIGVSNFPSGMLREAIREAPILTNQVEYHPLLAQDRLLAVCREEDVLLTAYSPLAKGRILDEVELKEVAEAHGRTVGQIALRWLVQQDRVAAVPKSASPQRREENLAVFDFTLTDEEMARITALARSERLINPSFAPDWER
ncbi:MAG TPA: aldo/keto reductase [Egibacteraceae bacterium]|jgi:2,5-diketo-D-gluconate reductase B|nr:aldo/keto reductase [Egibacteraceae bacterium]